MRNLLTSCVKWDGTGKLYGRSFYFFQNILRLLGCIFLLLAPSLIFSNGIYIGLDNQVLWLQAKEMHANLVYSNRSAPLNRLGTFNIKDHGVGVNGGLTVGYAFNRRSRWFSEIRLGLVANHSLLSSTVKGHWEYTLYLPANHYNYQYSINSTQLGLQLSTDVYHWHYFAPYVSVGVGVDWLKSGNFSITPIDNADLSSFHFVGARKRNLYYSGEIGIRYRRDHYALSLGYIYQSLGKVNSGQGQTDVGSIAPAVMDKVHAQGVALQWSYYF